MPSKQSDLHYLIELAQRRVRTQEGARLYGKPIGAVIGDVSGDPSDGKRDRPITIERLRSLQEQFEAAKKMGNAGAMKDLQQQFTLALTEFRKHRQDPLVLRELVSARGHQDASTQQEM